MDAYYFTLAEVLRERLDLIADHRLRGQNPTAHLERHHRQLADRHLFKNARRSTGPSGAVVVPFGLAFHGNNDRGRSDLGHDTHNAYL
jgi:hypothetical protein